MSTTHRFVGPNNGIPVACAFVVLLLTIAPALLGSEHLTAQALGWVAVVVLVLMSPMLVWITYQLQDVITYDSDTKTLQVLRRRALIPDAVYDYSGADVRSVSITRLLGEGDDLYFGRARMADRRQFRFTSECVDMDLVANAARALLSALGRSDDLPILYYDNQLLTTQPIPFSEAAIARCSSSSSH